MKPEDVDKLFKERLGKMSPTPSADLWSRLQDRIEDEMPPKEEKKPVMMLWARSYAVAAAITVLLSAGVVFYNVQQQATDPAADTIAQVDAQNATALKEAEADYWKSKSTAEVTGQVNELQGTSLTEESITKHDAGLEQTTVDLPTPKPVKVPVRKQPAASAIENTMVASVVKQKVQPQPEPVKVDLPETPVSFASAKTDMNAAPVEIIIKRTVITQEVVPQPGESEEVSGFEKKKTLAKNIFKQVKNLSNGEQVNLSELGVNADRIALETQIGKQKISKVINL